MELTPEVLLAIESGVKDGLKKLVTENGDPRVHVTPDQTVKNLVVNMTLELATLSIGHDTDKTPTCSIPLLPTLALLIKRMGATREAALVMLREVMEEALTLDKDAASKLLEELGVAEAEQAIKEQVIGKLPRTFVKKTVKASGATLTVTGVATVPAKDAE